MDERIEMQEIYCHECKRYVQFPLDLSINGNHVLKCPNCGHEHCRVVLNGRITDDRWDRRNGPTIQVSRWSITSTDTSISANFTWFSSSTSSTY